MCGLVTFMVDTAAALAKNITEQERIKICHENEVYIEKGIHMNGHDPQTE